MRDKLSNYAGLNPQPAPDTSEFKTLLSEIEFMLLDKDCDHSKEGRKAMSRHLLQFMVGRGFWPLGTRCRVTKTFKVKADFHRAGK